MNYYSSLLPFPNLFELIMHKNNIWLAVVKLSIHVATGHAMQIYNCLGQLRQL